jgi:hypothetical protein
MYPPAGTKIKILPFDIGVWKKEVLPSDHT